MSDEKPVQEPGVEDKQKQPMTREELAKRQRNLLIILGLYTVFVFWWFNTHKPAAPQAPAPTTTPSAASTPTPTAKPAAFNPKRYQWYRIGSSGVPVRLASLPAGVNPPIPSVVTVMAGNKPAPVDGQAGTHTMGNADPATAFLFGPYDPSRITGLWLWNRASRTFYSDETLDEHAKIRVEGSNAVGLIPAGMPVGANDLAWSFAGPDGATYLALDTKTVITIKDDIGAIGGALRSVLTLLVTGVHAIGGGSASVGWALILLAGVIKIVLLIPTHHQYKSMKQMQALQPELRALQDKYKGDKERLVKEQTALWKERKVNPFTGCLMALIQMPILFSIWRAISAYKYEYLKEGFLWISPARAGNEWLASSLAQRDLPLILVYGFSMFLSQRLSATDPATAKSQSMMNIMMPILLTWSLWSWNMPSALILYWLAFNALSIVHQYMVNQESTSTALMLAPADLAEGGDAATRRRRKKKGDRNR